MSGTYLSILIETANKPQQINNNQELILSSIFKLWLRTKKSHSCSSDNKNTTGFQPRRKYSLRNFQLQNTLPGTKMKIKNSEDIDSALREFITSWETCSGLTVTQCVRAEVLWMTLKLKLSSFFLCSVKIFCILKKSNK